ncbi:VOC family protein [Actinopolymorpha alba]|uniref:VOC family protein n=1 Tax=Actinopolymorpha alba TaxID=533267 RepID=UPI00035DD186|nr:VOC family protein [Actinopolymorpha alba]
MTIRWLTVFLDSPYDSDREAGLAFWRGVTRSGLSSWRGEREEFATLLPEQGCAFLRVQDVCDGPARCHLDVHSHAVRAEVARAVKLGATIVADQNTLVVLASPGGLAFCVVTHHGEHERPVPLRWTDGHRSLVDQICLDIPAGALDREVEFWAAFTGWERRPGSRPEFEYLQRPAGMPFRLLLQRLDTSEPGQPVRAHVDLACDDVEAEVRRHEQLGATVVGRTASWVTLRDPVGREYCVTSRDPVTGLLPPT